MPYVQKEEGLGAHNSSVQTSNDLVFELVPETPSLLRVNMPFLQFHTPNVRINNPSNDVVYIVVMGENGQLEIDTAPIVQGNGGGNAGESRSVAPSAGPSASSRAASITRSGVTAALLVTGGLLFLHGLGAGQDEA